MAEQVTYSRVYVFKGDPVRVERAIPQKLGPRKAGKPNPSLIFFNLPPECTELDVILYCKSIVPQICREVRFVVGPENKLDQTKLPTGPGPKDDVLYRHADHGGRDGDHRRLAGPGLARPPNPGTCISD